MVLLLLILSACSMCREFGAAPRELLILRWIHNIAIENREREDEDEVHRFIAVHQVFFSVSRYVSKLILRLPASPIFVGTELKPEPA